MDTGEWQISALPELTPEEGRAFHGMTYGGARRRPPSA